MFLPSVFFVQESKLTRKSKVKIDDYVIFEKIRKERGGGGLLTAVHRSLNPVSVSEDEDDEILVVEGKFNNSTRVRFINAYGPQENIRAEYHEDKSEEVRDNFSMKPDEKG